MSDEPRAERTTPHDTSGFLEMDTTRTYLMEGAFTESMVGMALGHDPEALVRADLSGRWNRGAKDEPVLILKPGLAREWAAHLLEAADEAEGDLARYLATGRVTE